MEDNQPPRLAKQTPLVIELKPSTIASAPTLGLPDFVKLFTLYVTEKDKVAMGALSQTMGTWDRPVVYLEKPPDSVAPGGLGCLRALVAVASLVQEATRLTLGQDLIVKSHMRSTLSCEGTPINGCQHPGLVNTRDCYVRTHVLLLSLVRP